MHKNAYFLKMTVKFASASGAPPPNPRLPLAAGSSTPNLRVVTSAYYYNFVEFVSIVKCILLSPSKNPQKRSK